MREACFSGTRVGALSGKRLRETQKLRLSSLSASTQMSRSTFQALTLLSDADPHGGLSKCTSSLRCVDNLHDGGQVLFSGSRPGLEAVGSFEGGHTGLCFFDRNSYPPPAHVLRG